MIDLSSIKQARYIKLGIKGVWEDLCLNEGTMRVDYSEVPYDLAQQSDKNAIRHLYIECGTDPKSATGFANQICDFYHCGLDTLWVTFSRGCLWWAVTDKAVEYTGASLKECAPHGNHLRYTIDGWHNASLAGVPLYISDLSGKLTKTAAYRQAICEIKGDAFEYLIRKLQDQDLPSVIAAKSARHEMLKSAKTLIQELTWQDFELFVELIFSQSGWRRISSLGATQKTLDLELLLPSTNERAIIQVKSRTNQAELDDYITKFKMMNAEKYFFIYHTAVRDLDVGNSDVILIGPERLAEMAFSTGLIDWLIEKAS